MKGEAKVTCRHRYAHTDNHTHTQGHPGRFKDRSCWTHPHGDKGRGGCRCTVELRGVGHTHGRPRAERQPVHIPTHRVTGRCCHTQGQGELLSLSHACVRACIHSNCTLPRNYKRPCHSRAHMRSHVPSLAVIVACHDSHCHSVKQKTQLHINTCVHNLATSIFLDSSVELRFCRQ